MIVDVLLRLHLPLTSLRGQPYDSAANMSGAYKGAQALIRKHSPLALFVHCVAHCTNLVAQDSCDASPVVRDILQHINALGVLLHQSGKAKRALKDVVICANPDTSIEAIRPLCPTRWIVRVDALQTVMKQLGCILEAMDEIYDNRGDISAKQRACTLRYRLLWSFR